MCVGPGRALSGFGHSTYLRSTAVISVYSRNGHDFTERFPSIAQLLHELPAKAAVLDGEVVASNADGSPNFARLHVRWARPGAIRLWAFDLLFFVCSRW